MAMSQYSGINNGYVQNKVYDMIGTAAEGALVYASDINLCDSMVSAEAGVDGIPAGSGVILERVDSAVTGINSKSVRLPKAGDAATGFAGIVVRTHQMKTNAKGQPGVDEGQYATILRNVRAGGRIWVTSRRGSPVAGDEVCLVVNTADAEKLPNGSFVTAASGGDAVVIPSAVWVDNSAEGELAQVEFLG